MASYRYASVVRTKMDDPVNDREAGTVEIVAGKCQDEVARTVPHDGGFLEIECEVIETFEAESNMARPDLMTWAARRAEEAGVP